MACAQGSAGDLGFGGVVVQGVEGQTLVSTFVEFQHMLDASWFDRMRCGDTRTVAELVLTPERRDQLAALLDDEQRLRAEFPKVVEYLDMAPRLPGTGDGRADAAFDLRFVHYMTGGGSVSANPYWDIVAPSVSERDGCRVVNGGADQGSARLAFAQMILQATYAYAIPSPETIAWVSRFCDSRPLVELGAGRGYWAGQLSRAGLVVDAYDVEPPDKIENVSFPRAGRQEDVWHAVGGLDEFRSMAGRTMCCSSAGRLAGATRWRQTR